MDSNLIFILPNAVYRHAKNGESQYSVRQLVLEKYTSK